MSKRSVDVLIGIVIIALIAGVIGYFVSPNFQAWAQVWLGRPDGLAATATTLAALATLFAVIVGLRGISIGRELANEAYKQAQEAIEENRSQFLEAQFNASRPLLVPISTDPGGQDEMEEPATIDWDAAQMFVTIQNVGTGIATNIWISFLPPAPMPSDSSQYVSRLGSPVTAGGEPFKVYLQQGMSLFGESDSLNEHSLCVLPGRATGSTNQRNRFIARMCMTYQDIFGRKHASIFDMSDRGIWINMAFLTNIERDLGEIDAIKENKSTSAAVGI